MLLLLLLLRVLVCGIDGDTAAVLVVVADIVVYVYICSIENQKRKNMHLLEHQSPSVDVVFGLKMFFIHLNRL